MKKTNKKKSNVTGLLLVGFIAISATLIFKKKDVILKLFEPKVAITKQIVTTAPPEEVPVPEAMKEIAQFVQDGDTYLVSLGRLKKETEMKAAIIKIAKEQGIEIDLDVTQIDSKQHNTGAKLFSSAMSTSRTLTAPSFGYNAEPQQQDEVVHQEVEPVSTPVLAPSLIDLVEIKYTVSAPNKNIVVLDVDGMSWDLSEEKKFNDLSLRKITNNRACIFSTNENRERCLAW